MSKPHSLAKMKLPSEAALHQHMSSVSWDRMFSEYSPISAPVALRDAQELVCALASGQLASIPKHCATGNSKLFRRARQSVHFLLEHGNMLAFNFELHPYIDIVRSEIPRGLFAAFNCEHMPSVAYGLMEIAQKAQSPAVQKLVKEREAGVQLQFHERKKQVEKLLDICATPTVLRMNFAPQRFLAVEANLPDNIRHAAAKRLHANITALREQRLVAMPGFLGLFARLCYHYRAGWYTDAQIVFNEPQPDLESMTFDIGAAYRAISEGTDWWTVVSAEPPPMFFRTDLALYREKLQSSLLYSVQSDLLMRPAGQPLHLRHQTSAAGRVCMDAVTQDDSSPPDWSSATASQDPDLLLKARNQAHADAMSLLLPP